MKNILTILLTFLSFAAFSQGITVTVGEEGGGGDATSLDGKDVSFFVDTLTNQEISGLKTLTDDVVLEKQITIKGGSPGAGKVLTSTDATGIATWEVGSSSVFAQLSDATSQKPTTTSPTAITFDTNDDILGIIHSTSTATEDIIISTSGIYTIFSQPQVERTSGAATQEFHTWFRIGTDDKGGVSSVSVANPSVITTDASHGLVNGQTVEILNVTTTPDINGQHIIIVTGASTYTIPVNVTSVTDGVGDWRRILDINDDVANSNVELRISGSDAADVIPLIITRDMASGEKINIMQSVSTTANGIGLVVINPAGEPRIPSIILTINKN